MNKIIDWIKSNPFISVCAVVALAGLLGLGYLRFVQAPRFIESRSQELKQINTRQKSLMSIRVPLPNADLNAPPIEVTAVVNQVVINDVNGVYSAIRDQYDLIRAEISDVNSKRHLPVLLGGSEIWPDGDTENKFDLYVQAADDYRKHFEALFSYGQSNAWNMPALRASGPPTKAEVEQVLSSTAFNFINSIGVGSASSLTKEQADQLYREQRVELMNLLTGRAKSIHLYADLPAEQDPFAYVAEETDRTSGGTFGADRGSTDKQQTDNGLPAGYPFQIAAWSFADSPPKPDQLWEGQVQLWIMRDIMQAIANLNRVEQGIEVAQADGTTSTKPATALNSPVKRLLRLETLPGYVGLHTIGGVFDEQGDSAALNPTGRFGGRGGFGDEGGFGAGGSAGRDSASVYTDPPLERKPKKPTERAEDHFGISPTGRVSNAVYDVRHTRLIIDIQWDKLPALMQALRELNFMTVVKAEVQDIDEYEVLRQGYVYGQSDVVRADLLIESLWFREWTGELMPKTVREKLLIEVPEGRLQDNAPAAGL